MKALAYTDINGNEKVLICLPMVIGAPIERKYISQSKHYFRMINKRNSRRRK